MLKNLRSLWHEFWKIVIPVWEIDLAYVKKEHLNLKPRFVFTYYVIAYSETRALEKAVVSFMKGPYVKARNIFIFPDDNSFAVKIVNINRI